MVNVIENFGDGVTRTWNENGHYYVIKIKDTSRETIDTYFSIVIDTFDTWDKTKPLYMIQDSTGGGVFLTPYAKGKINQLTDYVKQNGITLRLALVIENNFAGQVIRAFGRLLTNNSDDLHQSFFTSIPQAEEWIAKQQETAE